MSPAGKHVTLITLDPVKDFQRKKIGNSLFFTGLNEREIEQIKKKKKVVKYCNLVYIEIRRL